MTDKPTTEPTTAGEQMTLPRPPGRAGQPRLMHVFLVQLDGQGHFRERALTGWPLDLVVLPREPRTGREREWVEAQLRCRLVPDGHLIVEATR